MAIVVVGNSSGANNIAAPRLFVQHGGTVTVNAFTVSQNHVGNREQRYEINGGLLDVNGNAIIANLSSGGARLEQTGGAVDISGTLRLGSAGNSGQIGKGYVTTVGGTFNVVGAATLGNSHEGYFTNHGSTVAFGSSLGIAPLQNFAASATYSEYVQAASSTTVATSTNVGGGFYVGPLMEGRLTVTGGSFSTGTMAVGISGTGRLAISGGSVVTTGNVALGTHAHNGTSSSGKGHLTMSSGLLDIGGNLVFGGTQFGGDGTRPQWGLVAISGGTLAVAGTMMDEYWGDGHSFEVRGGTASISFGAITLNNSGREMDFTFVPLGSGLTTIEATGAVDLRNLNIDIARTGAWYPAWDGTYLDLFAGSSVSLTNVTIDSGFRILSSEIVNENGQFILRVQVIPEPTSLALLALAGGLAMRRRRR